MAEKSFSRGWKGHAATSFFIAMSLIALKEMRLSDVALSVSKPMEDVVTTRKFPNNDQLLRTKYTGIASLDYGLGFLVAAFLPGASGWDMNAYVQQIYFLVSFFSIISISSIEAGRKGNASSFIKWTSIWAVFYQTVGGAVVIPLWYLLFFMASAKESSWTPASRLVDTAYAKALLPSLVLGYLVPTVAMYIPFSDPGLHIHQALIASWQLCPLYVNILLVGISTLIRKNEPAVSVNKSQTSLKHLHRVYIVNFIACAAVHVITMALCISTKIPQINFVHSLIRLPPVDRLTMLGSLHYIFQVDGLIILGSALAAAWGVIWDLKHFGKAEVSTVEVAIQMTFSTVLFGPAATVSGVWLLREHLFAEKDVKKA
ncbi:hypothetical protein ONS95_005190 [Cadophora gregata]|uniref:uncharacterized protein n=1 Tax=Cadophora gregata TaxID=51156 RepID=UPI0026DBA21B|nr:uncharacterized protein ONS95_005190 [Cadophora gregata]KAK0104927.1 hypothetical protein ONS95_005190 [Cadophora gregata]KAK0114991.1 hypothetical protein ONS96_013465 [Cadophora gregata f. sp. sojae]